MITKNWLHKGVSKKGVLKSGGSVEIKKGIYTSINGCPIKSCKCKKGPWLLVNFGYDKYRKEVSGITYYFKNSIEFYEFLNSKHLN